MCIKNYANRITLFNLHYHLVLYFQRLKIGFKMDYIFKIYLWLKWRSSTEDEGPERPKSGPLATTPSGEEASVALEVAVVVLRVPTAPATPTVLMVVVVVVVVGVGISTGFLERLRPRCMWRSQYLWPVTTSLEHLHFFPSVLRHRPGSGSIAPLPQYPDCNNDDTWHVNLENIVAIDK